MKTEFHRPALQRGATLVVVLILLLIMMLLGLASLRGTLMEERMTANQLDRGYSFQAAEAALRAGEIAAANTLPSALPSGGVVGGGCANGLCAKPDPAVVTPVWEVEANWTAAPAITVDFAGATAQPKYIVELLADDVPASGSCTTSGDVSPDASCSGSERRYRVTARSEAAGRAQVMLQSIYAVP